MTFARRENGKGQECSHHSSTVVFCPVFPDPAHKSPGNALGCLGAAAPGFSHPCVCLLLEKMLHKDGKSLCQCVWGSGMFR